MLERLLAADLLTFFLVFCRLGSAMVVLPGFGDAFVAPRVRLALALVFAAAATPVIAAALSLPKDGAGIIGLILAEIGVGLFIGTAARVLVAALQIAGTVIAFQVNLSSALAFDPTAGQQDTVTGSFLSILGLTLLFVTDLHHLLLRGLVESYAVFIPGALPPVGDFANAVARIAADSFRIGLQLSTPFLLIGVVISLAMGLLARLMPQVQIFFIAIPAQILLGLFALMLTVSFGMSWFLGAFEESLAPMLLTG